ncbi:MAG: MaoC family dehydratase N-terminal domain-containing protein [Chloroflexi bacterium]|nr:MaoC family dehydratase N-terminal domain-containing protein [Chloroflexota bacterium]
MRQAIGKPTLPGFPPEDVTIWAILRYTAATEDPNPLWRDEEYAGKTRWGGVIAPPTFVEVYSPLNRTMRETGGDLVGLTAPFRPPFERQLLVGEDFEFRLPVRPGDAISSRVVLGDVWEGKGQSTSGRLVFMREDKYYRNRKDELVATVHWTRAFVEKPAPVPLMPAPDTRERTAKLVTIHPTQVCFEDVTAGMEIPSMEKRVTMITIAKWAGATGDVGNPHFDAEFAQKEYGLPGIVAHGALSGAYLAQLVTNWIGGWGVLRKHSTRNRGSVRPGDVLVCRGKVVRKWFEGNDRLVECETWAENLHGIKVTLGKSLVSLPGRSD